MHKQQQQQQQQQIASVAATRLEGAIVSSAGRKVAFAESPTQSQSCDQEQFAVVTDVTDHTANLSLVRARSISQFRDRIKYTITLPASLWQAILPCSRALVMPRVIGPNPPHTHTSEAHPPSHCPLSVCPPARVAALVVSPSRTTACR